MAYYKCGTIHPTQNSNVVIDTASGPIANFETPLAIPLPKTRFDVNAKQDLHGYNNPWPAGGGKNKCSMPNQTFEQFAEIEIDEIPAGSYAYSAVITSTDTDSDKCAIIFLDAEKNTLTSKLLNRSVGTSRISTTFTVSSPIKFLRLYAASGFPSGAGDTASFVDNMICLQSASNPTVFEPYENVCPIEGWSEINGFNRGSNFFNIATKTDGVILVWSRGDTYADAKSIVSDYIEVKEGIKFTSNYTAQWCCYDKNKNYLGNILFGTLTTASGEDRVDNTIPSGYGVYYLRLGFRSALNNNEDMTEKTDIVLSVGNSATPYEPYNGNTEVINLGGTYYGGHLTQDKAGHRQFEVTWCSLTDLGSFPWGSASNGRIGCNPTNMAVVSSGAVIGNIKSDCYAPDTQNNVYNRTNDKTIAMTNNLSTRMMLYDSDLGNKTSEEVKAALSGKNVIYELLEPYTIDLPDGEPINTFAGVNNFFADTGDTSLQFRKIG